ncbi:uncharacterized protein LOC106079673 [Biomphalaria glabrata]|uniref:Uncharacterized protein LOC106079673 n=1 Tax=Biomphalaria glabrata TaxID=6526 RepID=A0A9U8ENX2_BIOGL|nr:uncharacterized protein LOC106079673 [Biomphalaria glabrata]
MEYLSVWASYTNSNYCKFTAWISQSMVCVSIFLFALIAIDRYMKLCHTASASITPAASRNVTLVLTLVNAALAAPCLVIFDNNSRGVCQVQESMKTSLITAYYSFLFTLFLIMMAIVIFCYVRIAIKVRQSRRVRPIPETSKSEAMTRSEDGGEDYFTNPNVPQQQSTKDGELREVEGRQNNIQLTVVAPRVRFQSPNRGVNVLPQIYPALNTEIHPALATSVEADHEENLDVLNQIQTRRKFLRQQRNLRVTSLLFVITAIFILSWMAPYAAMVKGLYVGFRYPLSLGDLVLVMYGPNIYVINTFSNPLVYAILSPSYRKLVRNVLRKVRVISWRVVQCN